MKLKSPGFTIVELLIVIVVIGILSAVTTVTYSGMQSRATNAARYQEDKAWIRILTAYKAQEGHYPNVASQNYCLGTGFPNGNATPGGECRDYQASDPMYAYQENDNTLLMNELKKITKSLPSGPRKPVNGTVGPYINYWGTGYTITDVFNGNQASDCPHEMTYAWTDGAGRLLCQIDVLE